jgi:VCBS repeat-containing protein
MTTQNFLSPAVSVSVASASVTEAGTTNLFYTFSREGDASKALSINIELAGTADSEDYTTLPALASASKPAHVWTQLLGTSAQDYARSLTTGLDGSIYVAGYTGGALDGQSNKGQNDGFLSKYSIDGTRLWTRLLGTTGNEYANAVVTGQDGSIYVTGTTMGLLDGQTSRGEYETFLTKYTVDGTKVWTRLIGAEGWDKAYGLTVGMDGAIYIAGDAQGSFDGLPRLGMQSGFLVKYSADGVKTWVRLNGAAQGESSVAALTTGLDGSVYMSGWIKNGALEGNTYSGALNYDAFLVKYDTSGQKLWAKQVPMYSTPNTKGSLFFDSLVTGLDGSIYVGAKGGAFAENDSSQVADFYIYKYGAGGELVWSRAVGLKGNNYLNEDVNYGVNLTLGADGSIYISGYTKDSPTGEANKGQSDAFVAKFNTDGTKVWSKLLGSTGDDVALDLTTGLDGSIYVSGWTTGSMDGRANSGARDAFISKLSVDAPKISFAPGASTATLTVDPTADSRVEGNETVVVTVLAGTGYVLGSTFSATGIIDDTPPTASTFSPADEATAVAIGANVVATFSEAIKAGAGNLVLTNTANAADTRTIRVSDASQVSFAGSTLTVNPTSNLLWGAHYALTMGAGVIQDLAGNAYAGISSATTWNFSTALKNTPPTGAVTIKGTVKVGQTLTASNTLADADGMGTVSYQWFAAGAAISGATSSTLLLGSTQLGKVITVQASYTDGQQTAESMTSAPTEAVSAPLNHAPVLDASKAPALTGINQGGAAPVTGNTTGASLVSGLIAAAAPLANYSDADSDLPGIAITSVNPSGALYFSTDAGSTWANVGSVSLSSARLLYADANTWLRYVPDASFKGDLVDAVSFKAWDRTGGYSNGQAGVDAANKVSVQSLATYSTSVDARSVAASGQYALIGAYGNGASVEVVDISKPDAPVKVGSYQTSGTANGMDLIGSTAYLACDYDGLVMVDISNPSAPTRLGSYNTSGNAYDVTVRGKYAYVADYFAGLQIIDVSNPALPILVGTCDTSGYANAVALSGNYAYVADYYSGLSVIDVSNPAAPVVVGSLDTPGVAYGVTVSGSYAYVADTSAGLQVIDVAAPASPKLVGTYQGGGRATLVGDTLYVPSSKELLVLDVSKPTAPQLTQRFDTVGYATDLAVVGSNIYVASGQSGLQVFQESNVSAFSLATDTVSLTVAASSAKPVYGAVHAQLAYSGDTPVLYELWSQRSDVPFQNETWNEGRLIVRENAGKASIRLSDYSRNQIHFDIQAGAVLETSAITVDVGGWIEPWLGFWFNYELTDGAFKVTNSGAGRNIAASNVVVRAEASPPYLTSVLNSLPSGGVSISGTAAANSLLTASNDIFDTDGVSNVSYQWFLGDAPITGATSKDLIVPQGAENQWISVWVQYTDGKGNVERLRSELVMGSNSNTAPVLTTPAPIFYVDTAGNDTFANKTGSLTATDANNDTLTYGVSGGSVANGTSSKQGTYGSLSVNTSTGAYTFVANDAAIEGIKANTSETYTVTVSDGKATTNANLSVSLTGANDAPTGAVTISGSPKVGQTLAASNSLADAEGMGTVSYQWFAAGTAISGATASSLVLGSAQQGKAITVKASYTDGLQTAESMTSAATAAVAQLNSAVIFASNLSGQVYEWKSHALLSDVGVKLTQRSTSKIMAPLFELKGLALNAQGDATAELWVNFRAASGSLDLTLQFDKTIAASFVENTAALPSGWSVIAGGDTGSLSLGAFGLTDAIGSVKLGVLNFDLPTGVSAAQIKLVDGSAGASNLTPYAVSVGGSGLSATTGADGKYGFELLDAGSYQLDVSKTLTTAETGSAINSADALAALKIAVGRNPNADPDGTGPQQAPVVSPYQFIAADANQDGKITSADALAILKMAVKRTDAPAREWLFVNENQDFWNETTSSLPGSFTTTRGSVVWEKALLVTSPLTTQQNVVAVLKGDVNGSWTPPTGAQDLDITSPAYFTELAAKLGTQVNQWAVIG